MVRKDALGLFREHPDWFQKGMDGKVLGTADEEQYLDPTHPGARKFIRAMIRNARAEGFRYFKIDYNQVDHNCRYFNPKKTRFEAFRDLYTLYREEMGDSYLLACADYERATFGLADVSPTYRGPGGIPGRTGISPRASRRYASWKQFAALDRLPPSTRCCSPTTRM